MPMISAEDHDRGLRCVAQLMNIIRPDWEFNGCLAILRSIDGRALPEIARAALWYAEHRTQQQTPAMLAKDGRHWHLDDDQTTPALPPKPKCLTEPMGEPVDAQVMADARARIRDARRTR